jgi:hypothetical protein
MARKKPTAIRHSNNFLIRLWNLYGQLGKKHGVVKRAFPLVMALCAAIVAACNLYNATHRAEQSERKDSVIVIFLEKDACSQNPPGQGWAYIKIERVTR